MASFDLKHGLAGLLACCALAAPGAADTATGPAEGRPLKLALFFTQENAPPGWEGLEDLFLVHISSQPRLRLVDRSLLKRVLKEQALTLAGLADNKKAVAVGKIAGADFLLFIKVLPTAVAVRLVEVAGGKLRLEDRLAPGKDPHLTAAALREMVLKSLKLRRDIKDSLTVGITAFPNRSGTDRSDKLGLALQQALRKRLREEPWATVLERQYPTSLLDEVELTRFGLAKGPAEKLPPADVVVLGAMEDADKEYTADKSWRVKLDLTVRLRKQSARFDAVCRSDELDKAADRIVRQINAMRHRQGVGESAESEAGLWRRHALYLMPRPQCADGRAPHDCLSRRQKLDTREAIRAWENILLLDADDAEATMNLGVCLISLSRHVASHGKGAERQAALRQLLRGSRLVERAVRAEPTGRNPAVFYHCIESVRWGWPDRSAEMFEHVLANPEVFADWQLKHARIGLAVLRKDRIFPEIDRAVRNVQKDPGALCTLVIQMTIKHRDSPDKVIAFAAKYTNSKDPLVQFLFEYATAEMLWRWKKDASALAHFDRAIRAHEGAYAACRSGNNCLLLDDIYRFKLVACKSLGKPEEARKTALAGARHFMRVGRFNHPISWLYYHCVSEVLKEGREKEALAICDAYLAAVERHPNVQDSYGPPITEKRQQLTARLAGRPVPDFEGMRLVHGTETAQLNAPRMAAAAGKLWLAWQPWQSGGPALVYRPGNLAASRIPDLPKTMRGVAAVGEKVFFGGRGGLYRLDAEGKVRKHYSKANNRLPSDHIVDLCAGGGKLYLSFRESDRYGVAVLDPVTDAVSVLAPSSRQATLRTEPVYGVYRLWWDAAGARLYASYYRRFATVSDRTYQFGWMQDGKGWRKLHNRDAPRMIVSQGDEALEVTIPTEATVFHFLKSGRKVRAAVPLPWLMGEPAWDGRHIWVPTYTGLYEIDRTTGKARWLAHQEGNPCLSVLKHDGRLYVATTRGLYYRQMPK